MGRGEGVSRTLRGWSDRLAGDGRSGLGGQGIGCGEGNQVEGELRGWSGRGTAGERGTVGSVGAWLREWVWGGRGELGEDRLGRPVGRLREWVDGMGPRCGCCACRRLLLSWLSPFCG